MSYINIASRTTEDLNASADINQLMMNDNFILNKIYEEILTEIELLKVESCFCDPLNIPSEYMIADGSAFPSLSEAKIIHNTGGTILSGTPFERTYTAKGLTNIPNVLGQHLRYSSMGSTVSPGRDDRRQAVSGTVDISSGVVIYLSAYHINIIKNAVDNSRPVIIGQAPTTIFDDLTVYGTVSTINTTLNYIVLTSVTGTFTAGSGRSLIIKGDVVGSFQNDQLQDHIHYMYMNQDDNSVAPIVGNQGGRNTLGLYTATSAVYSAKAGLETRGKNIALLPLVRVYI